MGTMLAIFALLVAAGAVFYAWRLQQDVDKAANRLDRYNKALFQANDEIRQLRDQAAATAAELRVLVTQRPGALRFGGEMTVREVQMAHPQAQQILASLHLGGCSSCAVDPDQTLVQICRESGRDLAVLLEELNRLDGTAGGTNGAISPLVKLANVQVDFDV